MATSSGADNVTIGLGRGSLRAKIDAYFAGLGQGINAYGLRRARMHEILVLESQSDERLAEMGLTRERILPHVFRDLFGD
ncbi:hypothetical protein CEW88_05695 [Alloyangia pacifica]|uniref:DUF1127 domain-containing protein n=1 Tax=Alloyangia pacifica TaxID=311180 RepID=A0A2U8HBP2_9RHOB|nr:hypothetical protein [Alloyangia pacifica]AWI83201.1 hypothetical protein CEW88_05695 [Alloyangia pacifica]